MIKSIRDTHFRFDCPEYVPVLMHIMFIEKDGSSDKLAGYLATEDYKTVGTPHMHIMPDCRNAKDMKKCAWVIEHVYFKLMKALGKYVLATNCSQDDKGTINCLKIMGFSIKPIVIAERKL